MKRIVATAALAAVLATALSGCAGLLGPRTGDDVAKDAARDAAHRIATAIDDSRPRNVLASDFAYRYSAPTGSSWQLDRETDTELTAEALSWKGMTRDRDGARFVLRITAHASARSSQLGHPGWSDGAWSGCYAFRVFAFFERRDTSVDGVNCPTAPVSPPPSPLPAPALPDDAADRLAAVLAGATKASLAADLEAAFPDGSVRSDPVTGAHLTRDSGSEGAVLAAAVGISGTKDCTLGTRAADGTVRVGSPQPITLEAGEAGCTIGNALHPVKTH